MISFDKLRITLYLLRNLGGTVLNYLEPQSASILGLFYLEISVIARRLNERSERRADVAIP